MEEEGLYTGPEPDVPTRNINTMEQRLLRQPDKVQNYCNLQGNIRYPF